MWSFLILQDVKCQNCETQYHLAKRACVTMWYTLWTQSHDQDQDVCCTCHPCCNYCPINYICTCIIAGSMWYSTDSTNLHKLAYMKWYCLLFDHKGNYWCGRVDSGSWSCLDGEGVAAAYTIGIRLALLQHTHCTGSRHVRINGCFMSFSPDYTLHTTIARVITVLEGQSLVSYVYTIGIHLRLHCLSPLQEVASTHIMAYTAAVVIQKALDCIMLYVHTYIILLYSASYYLDFHAFFMPYQKSCNGCISTGTHCCVCRVFLDHL